MPAKHVVKEYIENGYYHIYNRGVEKRDIFLDTQDCAVFLHYLKIYLLPIEKLKNLYPPVTFDLRINKLIRLNLSKEMDLLCISLMPNHIHFLIKQYTKDAIVKFMRRILTSYVMYFNKRYKRVGGLFQGTYKAVPIHTDDYLLHLSRYIHLNPMQIESPIDYMNFSSYPYYLGKRHADWIKTDEILGYFKKEQKREIKVLTYQNFVEDYIIDTEEYLGDLRLEDAPM